MSVADAGSLPVQERELAATVREWRQPAVLPVAALMLAVGVLLFGGAAQFREPLHATVPGLLLVALALGAWGVYGRRPGAAAWVLIGGLTAVDALVAVWAAPALAARVLVLLVGLGAVLVSIGAGAGLAAGCTVLLFVLPGFRALDREAVLSTLGLMWGVVGLIWLDERPLQTALGWWRSGYEESRRLLEEARDTQLTLKQTLEELAQANLQLTRLHRLAQGLREAAEEARAAKERFVANVSHELRTPLNMILGFGEMILKTPTAYGQRLPPALLADLAVVVRNSQHLSSLIDDVLDLSQIEAGQMALSRERVALSRVVEEAAVAVRPLFEAKGLYLETEVADDTTVFCDPTRIREVVINLLSNAGRFTERGGVRVRLSRRDSEVVVSVADTGAGISEDDQQRLFRPFEQLDATVRRRYGGSGLGLSISKRFVELHGGKMWVESAVGQGATFYFTLPVQPAAPPDGGALRWLNPHQPYQEPAVRPRMPVSPLRPRFVVVEQGDALQRLIGRYYDGAQVVAVRSIEEAAREMAETPPQALLVNAAIPYEDFQHLKRSALLPYSSPAIICSIPDVSARRSALGVADYLVKPVSRERLQEALGHLSPAPRSVLIVDDDADAVHLFRRMLLTAGRGYRVLTASNGRQALEILRADRVDVVLLDLLMPEMDGFQFLEQRAREPSLCEIPVIVLSACDPAGQPIASDVLVVTRGGGISAPQLLECIEALSRLLGTAGQVARPAPSATPGG